MNIQTVAENLRRTIAGKEKLLTNYTGMRDALTKQKAPSGMEQHNRDLKISYEVGCNMLEINIDELKRILQDVEQCIPKIEHDLDGPMIKKFRED
jgi:hypothetical protein